MLRIHERSQKRLAYTHRSGFGVLWGPLLFVGGVVVLAWGGLGPWPGLALSNLGLLVFALFSGVLRVDMDKGKNLLRVVHRRFLLGTTEQVLPLDSVTSVSMARKSQGAYFCAVYVQGLDEVRVSGLQLTGWLLFFFTSQVSAFLDKPCVRSGKLDPIGKLARGEKHPLDRLIGPGKDVEKAPWKQEAHPLDRLTALPEAENGPGQDSAEETHDLPGRGPDGNPLQ
ncbi:MAG: hypothetical protein D6E12_01195 [Desulfovibrio sp.]|nr:MAG: hypothetical protein D6E12_01195 [Desulfovibrio sp.]